MIRKDLLRNVPNMRLAIVTAAQLTDTPPALTPPVITPPTTTTPAVQAAAEAERAAYKKRRGRRSTILTAGSSRDYTEGYGLGSGLSGKKKVAKGVEMLFLIS